MKCSDPHLERPPLAAVWRMSCSGARMETERREGGRGSSPGKRGQWLDQGDGKDVELYGQDLFMDAVWFVKERRGFCWAFMPDFF